MSLRDDANQIVNASIAAVLPDEAVKKALAKLDFGAGRLVLVAIGKAAWQMAAAAVKVLGSRVADGVVITKYDHSKGEIPGVRIYEAGHPVPDNNSFAATQEAINLVSDLTPADTVLFLISGGGSALFEKPLVSPEALENVTKQLLACGANIVEMNTIRKRLSAVKGGRFAEKCAPAKVISIILSDIIGDPLDMIASGPAYPDSSTCEMALEIVGKHRLDFDEETMRQLRCETPKALSNIETYVTGSVHELCCAAASEAKKLGYSTIILTSKLACQAFQAGALLASIAKYNQDTCCKLAFILGGETVVHVKGKGLGGRNQELALSAAREIDGLKNTAVFSFGSDGTDGPTDAAGGYVDGDTAARLRKKGISIEEVLADNDAYHALKAVDGLIMTGATGTNVNDASIVLIKR